MTRIRLTTHRLAFCAGLMLFALAATLLLIGQDTGRQHQQQRNRGTETPRTCADICLVGFHPDISSPDSLSFMRGKTREPSLLSLVPAEWKAIVTVPRMHQIGLATDESAQINSSNAQFASAVQVSASLPYNELALILGAPLEVFYQPLNGELVTVYDEQIFTATRMSEVCRLEPDDLWSAPTVVVYMKNPDRAERIRTAPLNIGLDRDGFTRWLGELNIALFCAL